MKKFFLLLALLVVLCSLPYIFVPNRLEVSKVTLLPSNERTLHRCLTRPDLLARLLSPAPAPTNVETYSYEHHDVLHQYRLSLSDLVEVRLKTASLDQKSFITLQKISPDSTAVQWRTEVETSYNPVTRVLQYMQAKKMHNSMAFVLDRLQRFASQNKNVYGLAIERTTVTDSLLVTTRIQTVAYPSPKVYFGLIHNLQAFVEKNGAAPVNYPMLNVTPVENNAFQVTVGLPVNRPVTDDPPLLFRKMVPGKILSAEVRGGPHSVEEGFRHMNDYLLDHELVTPAIPFQSLVTDRTLEPDTTKWVTRIYFPIL